MQPGQFPDDLMTLANLVRFRRVGVERKTVILNQSVLIRALPRVVAEQCNLHTLHSIDGGPKPQSFP